MRIYLCGNINNILLVVRLDLLFRSQPAWVSQCRSPISLPRRFSPELVPCGHFSKNSVWRNSFYFQFTLCPECKILSGLNGFTFEHLITICNQKWSSEQFTAILVFPESSKKSNLAQHTLGGWSLWETSLTKQKNLQLEHARNHGFVKARILFKLVFYIAVHIFL